MAARLVDLDPAAAKAQIAEIEQVSRQALADVRTTASGMREVRLATEIASARSVLLAAGIESRMPSALPPLTDQVERAVRATWSGRRSPTWSATAEAGVCTVVVDRRRSRSATTVAGSRRRSDRGSGLVGLRQPGRGGRRDARRSVPARAAEPSSAPSLAPAGAGEGIEPASGGDRPVITVLLADDQAMIRQAFTALLQLEADIRVVGQAGDVAETVRKVDETAPEVVLLDVQMPSPEDRGADGIDACAAIMAARPGDPGDHPDHLRPARATCAGRWRPGRSGTWSRTRRPSS